MVHILSIGKDPTLATANSPVQQRSQLYGNYAKITIINMGKGSSQTFSLGENVTVILPGGQNIATAFLRALYVAAKKIWQDRTITVVTTQDVLYVGLVGYIVSRLRRLPFYVQLHGDYLDNPAWFASQVGVGNRIMNGVGKWILRQADAVRAVSLRLKNQLVNDFKIPADRIISLPIGTNLSIFAQATESERRKEILFVGRLIPEKEPFLFCEVAIAVAQANPVVTIGIAGDGFLRNEMSERFAKVGLLDRVTFYGSLDQPTLAKIYSSVYCYIHTAGWEGWGMPMIESMAAGCPVVTTDSGCAGEAIRHDETGLVVPVGDQAGLIRETLRLLADESLWRTLVDNGRVEANVWSIAELAKRNMSWYADAKRK